jgi:hypothetical protein
MVIGAGVFLKQFNSFYLGIVKFLEELYFPTVFSVPNEKVHSKSKVKKERAELFIVKD